MLTDFKYWYIRRISDSDVGRSGDGKHGEPGRTILQNDVGQIVEVAVRYFEGDVTTAKELVDGVEQDVTRYRRFRRLKPYEMPRISARATDEASGRKAFRYTSADFGITKDLADVEAYLKRELERDTTRTPIVEQTLTSTERTRLESRGV